jgi:hypothetical protein
MRSAFKTLSRRPGSETSSEPDEKAPILKMAEREDWALFRSVEGLCQKAGVRPLLLRRLVLKELADNALDTGAHIRFGLLDPEKNLDLFFVEDDGPGLDGSPEEIASLFSIRRSMRSSRNHDLDRSRGLGRCSVAGESHEHDGNDGAGELHKLAKPKCHWYLRLISGALPRTIKDPCMSG